MKVLTILLKRVYVSEETSQRPPWRNTLSSLNSTRTFLLSRKSVSSINPIFHLARYLEFQNSAPFTAHTILPEVPSCHSFWPPRPEFSSTTVYHPLVWPISDLHLLNPQMHSRRSTIHICVLGRICLYRHLCQYLINWPRRPFRRWPPPITLTLKKVRF